MFKEKRVYKCLENNDLDSIRKDLDKRPIEGVDGNADDETILRILKKYVIYITELAVGIKQPAKKNKKTIRENPCNSWTRNKKNNSPR